MPACRFFFISIHKALAGLDMDYEVIFRNVKISIHKALAGLDRIPPDKASDALAFQSTRPSRASTVKLILGGWNMIISIHKALAGLDMDKINKGLVPEAFQSTRPSRAST